MTEPTTTSATPTRPTYKRARPKVPPFARYEGTSAWKKDRRRGREYARYLAAQAAAQATAAATATPPGP